MNQSKRKLIEDFTGNKCDNSNYERNWVDLIYVSKIICTKLGNFGENITPHERKLLVDLRQRVRDNILTFDKDKIFDSIIDFIETFNITQPRKK